jgi:hypothetical protein
MLRTSRKSNKYQFYSLWFDPTGARTHDLPPSRWTRQPLHHFWFFFSIMCLFPLLSFYYVLLHKYVSFLWKIEDKIANADDSSLNGIQLSCGTRKHNNTGKTIISRAGPWGPWHRSFTICRKYRFLTSFNMQVERPTVSKISCWI